MQYASFWIEAIKYVLKKINGICSSERKRWQNSEGRNVRPLGRTTWLMCAWVAILKLFYFVLITYLRYYVLYSRICPLIYFIQRNAMILISKPCRNPLTFRKVGHLIQLPTATKIFTNFARFDRKVWPITIDAWRRRTMEYKVATNVGWFYW